MTNVQTAETMANFSKKFSLSEFDSSYQISVTGDNIGRQTVITKFANEKTWSVSYFYRDSLKADYIEDGFKRLQHAKDESTSFVMISKF